MPFGIQEAKYWIKQLNDQIQQQKAYLTDLDQAIGDGDHGLNMSRGFQEVIKKIESSTYSNMGSLFKDVGMTLLTKVGGASGPLYGTIFLRGATVLTNQTSINVNELIEVLTASLEGIVSRGKAQLGDKTMVDVWLPLVAYLQAHAPVINWDEFIALAKEKMETTKVLEAKKGRASYLGKRSIGHIDPGAASSYLFFKELAIAFKGANNG
ncbi:MULTISPECIES: dihydroxyacetone kinase subunit DhaL [Bacillus]|uniref:dihydroxyacetone kinase subunit DhaL n=1 Tax=Bacillus TaxID=1386 RepID=UPI0002D651D4|nr:MULTISPECIES: dihydroxyacetone kinase subunit DhaL [Bacillus]